MTERDNSGIALDFIKSWADTEGRVNSTDEIQAWIQGRNKEIHVDIRKVPFDSSDFWFYDELYGRIRNKSNSFFSIAGLRRTFADGVVKEQPVIIQDEIGFLGIIVKKIDGVLHCLMQAKIEPGNINKIQLSPTIQATKSNFTQKHGGDRPPYLDYFIEAGKHVVVVDQLQSEQSSRFFKKRNRNIIIMVNDEVQVLPSHRWMTIGQIKQLMKIDNLVNMDTRTVLSCIPYSIWTMSEDEKEKAQEYFSDECFFESIFEAPKRNELPSIYHYINNYKMFDETVSNLVPLKELSSWQYTESEFVSTAEAAFKVVFCDITIEGREVRQWTQPLVEATEIASFGMIQYNNNGRKEYIIAAKPELGAFDGIEIGPTLQSEGTSQGSYFENLLSRKEADNRILHNVLLSEEGGRFYHEQNRNVIIEVEQDQIGEIPSGYFSMDYYTLNILTQVNNCLNIQLRNLLSLLEV